MHDDLQTKGMAELRQLAAELAPSCAPPKDCTQAVNWGRTELSTLYGAGQQLWPFVASGGVQATAGPIETIAGGLATIPRVGLGFALGAGFDAAGQYAISYAQTGQGNIRPEQSLFAGLTGGIALPLTAGRGMLTGALGGAGAAGANTTFNNWMYEENTNTFYASTIGGAFGAAGTGLGSWLTNRLSFTPTIPVSGNVPRIPAQPPLGAPYAAQIGNGTSNTIGGVPSFIPLSPNTPQITGDGK